MRSGIIIILILVFSKSLSAQCPDKKFLWQRIVYLRESLISKEEQLTELLSYLNKTNQCRNNNNDSSDVLLLQRIGALYGCQKDFSSAIDYTLKSIALITEHKDYAAVNPIHVIKSYYNLQILYDSLNLGTKKYAAIDSCINLTLRLHAEYDYALSLLPVKIEELFHNADYYGCIKYAEAGESIVLKNEKTINYREYFEEHSIPWEIDALIFLNRTHDAEKMVMDKIQHYEKEKNTKILGALYNAYGLVHMNNGNFRKALYYFEKALNFNKKINHSDGCAEALNNAGFMYSTCLHQNKMAIRYYIHALNFADANESLNILDNIANIYVTDGKYDSAFFFFKKGFDQLHPGFKETDLLREDNTKPGVRTTEYITGMVLDMAAAWLSKFRANGNKDALAKAIHIYEVADQYFDKLKTSQSEIQSRLFWKTNNRRLYEQAIEACYISHDIEKAFYFFEKSRSVLLNDQITEQRQMDDRDLAKQAQLKKSIQEITERLQIIPPVSTTEIAALRQQLFTNEREQEVLVKNSRRKHPSYAHNNSDTDSIKIEWVKKNILNATTSLLEIFTGDSAVYTISVTTNHVSFIKLDKRLYDSLTTAYISFVDNSGRLQKNFPGFLNLSHCLYELIFQNTHLQPAGSLIISPDGKNFPFEALVTGMTKREPHYLLEQYATSYTYSAKYLANQFNVNTQTTSNVLAVAPVKYDGYQNLAELNGSDKSLENISGYFSNIKYYVLEKATRNNFINNFSDYIIIQLYTHASDGSKNNDPVIYFADSALSLSELIPERKPITRLVVLSACETAKGKLYEGEGIFSFNRGFAALGIPAAISSLWSVENESSYRITEFFYKYLSQGMPTDVALQKAKVEFINTSSSLEKKLPYFWAGSILTGKVDSFKIKKSSGLLWYELIGATILMLVLVYSIGKRFTRN